MAKAKKISINAFEKAVKENFQNTVTEEWRGLQVTISRTISLKEMMSLVSEVVDNCFLSDGQFVPEIMQALLECGVVEHYTNITLPSNLEARYELVTRSDIMDFIMPRINSNQYNDIVVAIRDKIDYMCDSNTAEFNRAVEQAIESVNEATDSARSLFAGINEDSIRSVFETLTNDMPGKQKIVDEYISRKNAELKIVGEE